MPWCSLFCEVQEGLCYFQVVFDKVSVVACEPQEFPDLSHAAGAHPGLHLVDLHLFHLYHAFHYSYTQEVKVVLFEGALFWVEVEVVFAKSVKDLSDQVAVSSEVIVLRFPLFAPGVNCYVIHVDHNTSSINEVSEYGIHHGLEGGRGVSQAEEHHSRFKQPFIRDEGRFPPVFLFDEDLIVPPLNVHPHK